MKKVPPRLLSAGISLVVTGFPLFYVWDAKAEALLSVSLILVGSFYFHVLVTSVSTVFLMLNAVLFMGNIYYFSAALFAGVALLLTAQYITGKTIEVVSRKSNRFASGFFVVAVMVLVATFIVPDIGFIAGVSWSFLLFFVSYFSAKERGYKYASLLFHTGVNVLLLAVGLLCAAAVLELGSRFLLEDLRKQHPDFIMRHPEYIFTLTPGYKGTVKIALHNRTDIQPVKISISEQGLRDNYIGPKEPDELRIALVGDSFTFGWGVDDDQTLDNYLEALLEKQFPDRVITVINGGVGNYGPWQSLGLFKERILPLKPDIVLFQALVANDIGDTLRKKQLFLETFDRECAVYTFQLLLQDLWQYQTERFLTRHSAAYCQALHITRRETLVVDLLAKTVFAPAQTAVPVPHPAAGNIWRDPDRQEWYGTLKLGWQMLLEDLSAFRDTCLNAGMDVYFYNIPYPIMECPHDAILAKTYDVIYEPDKADNMLLSFYEEHAWEYIPVREHLRQTTDFPVVFCGNGHLTPEGNALLAQKLCSFLVEVLENKR